MKVLILANHPVGLYKFRKELLEAMAEKKYKVYVSVPEGEFTRELEETGCRVLFNKYLDRRGINPVQELRLLRYFYSLVKRVSPDIVFTYTIKPNIYGGLVCAKLGIPYITNITGLGTSIQNGGAMQVLTLIMYKFGLRKAQKIFFQNRENLDFMLKHRTVSRARIGMLPGSGVNTSQYCYEKYPEDDKMPVFTAAGRIMKDKGTDELLEAAQRMKKVHPNIVFRLIGDFDEGYEEKIFEMQKKGIVEYLGFQKDIRPFLASSHAVIHASYHEGMSNVLQEAASTGRPVIATDVHGCIEIFEPDVTGIACRAGSADSLTAAIEKFLSFTHAEKEEMGKRGREKMVREFDRSIVVNQYMREIDKLWRRKK